MAQFTTTTDTTDALNDKEDVEDVIYRLDPMDTWFFTNAKRKSAKNVYHQWHMDALAAGTNNAVIEGDEASFVTAVTTTALANYCQISRKGVTITDTVEAVSHYGFDSRMAYELAKRGKELKRDIEVACLNNTLSSEGGSGTARQAAGLAAMIGNRQLTTTTNSTGTVPGFAAGNWGTAVDGTAATMIEVDLLAALGAAWTDGGDPSVVLVGARNKQLIAGFAGANKFGGFYNPTAKAAQGMVIQGVDLYVSDYGSHKIVLSRYITATKVFCIDPDYVSLAWLRPIRMVDLAKTGDATKRMLIGEFVPVCDNTDAHSQIIGAKVT